MIRDLAMTLMMGPGVPVPAPRMVLDALQSVKVISETGATQSGFELSFHIDRNSPLVSLFMLSGGAAVPFFRVLVIVTLSGKAETLIDGVATQTQMAPGVLGHDLSRTVLTRRITRGRDRNHRAAGAAQLIASGNETRGGAARWRRGRHAAAGRGADHRQRGRLRIAARQISQNWLGRPR